MMSGLTSRRLAVATAAVSSLALAGEAAAKKGVDAEGKKRGRRGKKGKKGPQGPGGPAAGAGATVVRVPCSFSDSGDPGDTQGCDAPCPAGYVAVGGGYEGPRFIDDLGIMISSFPTQNAQNQPVGWRVRMEYLNLGQEFEISTYAICLPE
jgi:hypothetical protein